MSRIGIDFEIAKEKDFDLSISNPHYINLSLKKCICGGQPHIDTSMALIQCNNCELSFEYRYNRGTVPYHTWQLMHKEVK